MKILPHDNVLIRFEDVLDGLNRDPKPGDEGHTDDHARLSQVVFDVPQTTVALGVATKSEEGWLLNLSSDYDADMVSGTWESLLEFADRPGVVAVAGDPHAAADGVTDWTEDGAELDGVELYLFASGVVGLTHAVADLIQQVNTLKQAGD